MTSPSPKTFSELLRTLRYARGHSLRSLARSADVVHSYISKLEHDGRAGQKVARRLAEALDLRGDERDAFLLAAADTSRRERLHSDVVKLPSRVVNHLALAVAKAMRVRDAIVPYSAGPKGTDCYRHPEEFELVDQRTNQLRARQNAGRVAKFYVNMRLEDLPAEKREKLLQNWPGFPGGIVDLAVELADGTWQVWEFKTLKL